MAVGQNPTAFFDYSSSYDDRHTMCITAAAHSPKRH